MLSRTGYTGSDGFEIFMGAGLLPDAYEESAGQVAGLLKKDGVDAVFLTPV